MSQSFFASTLLFLVFVMRCASAVAQQKYDHCSEHPDSPKCLLFCSECGHHSCECPPDKPYVYDECSRARDALKGAIYGGSVIVVSSTRGTLPESEALAHVESMSCADAIKKATELTNYKEANDEERPADSGGEAPAPSPPPPPPVRAGLGGPYAGWESGRRESEGTGDDAQKSAGEPGQNDVGDNPEVSPEEEALQDVDGEKSGADNPDPMQDPEFRKLIEQMNKDFAHLAEMARAQDAEEAKVVASILAAEAEAKLPAAVEAAADYGGYIDGGGDGGDLFRALVVGSGNDDPYWNMAPTLLDGVAALANVVFSEIPFMPGVEVTTDGKFEFDIGDTEGKTNWGMDAVISAGEKYFENRPGVKLASKLSDVASGVGIAGSWINPISEERREKLAADGAKASSSLVGKAQQFEDMAANYAQQVKSAGLDLGSPEHQKVMAGFDRKAKAYKAAAKVVETNVKIRNGTSVWLPGPWAK